MLTFLIPTSKELTKSVHEHHFKTSSKTLTLVKELTNLSLEELSKAYKLKEAATQIEYNRLSAIVQNKTLATPALELFNGLMYRNINRNLSISDKDYVTNHVFVCSSLFGIIPAYQPIPEHRLDFQTKVKVNGQSLKTYWCPTYDDFVNNKQGPIISLLSTEFENVFSANVRKNFITVQFFERTEDQLKSHSTISKKARGKFLTQAIHSHIEDVDDLKKLTFDGFIYQESLSTNDTHLVFVKDI